MLLIAASRKLQHPLGPIPWSLAINDGTLKKTNKYALARHIENDATPTVEVELPSAAVIDGMALVQTIDGDNITFAEVSEQIFKTALSQRIQQVQA
jgi:hypothetical protein